MLVDFLLVAALLVFRIPRLNYNKTAIALFISFIWFIDGLMFGGISLNVGPQLSKSSTASHVGSSGESFPTLISGVLIGL
jgi:nucleoporin POM152